MTRALLASFLAIAVIACAGGCPDPTGLVGGTGGGSSGGTTTAADADQILTLVNAERTGRGLLALTRNALLDAAAQAHANDMRANSFFSHTGSDGSNVGDRATAAGYSWTTIGENIGEGSHSPEDMMDLWMNSPGHRANILNPDFTDLGVGINDSGTTLWVQVFGRP